MFHCVMAAQYGKMAMWDVIPPWSEMMVRYPARDVL
jgi:hypothetical protein